MLDIDLRSTGVYQSFELKNKYEDMTPHTPPHKKPDAITSEKHGCYATVSNNKKVSVCKYFIVMF